MPGRYRRGFFTPSVVGADFQAALWESCLKVTFLPIDFWAVCLVDAIVITSDECVGVVGILIYENYGREGGWFFVYLYSPLYTNSPESPYVEKFPRKDLLLLLIKCLILLLIK